jgi:YtkA-like protein
MKRITAVCVMVVLAAVAAACGGGQPSSSSEPATTPEAAAPAPAATSQNVDITLTSEPDPPKMGENTFEVMVMAGGQPVTDADVAVELFMPAMPEMKMAEMRSRVPLKNEGNGQYRGTGNVMMAGKWDATVSVTRAGQEVGNRKFPVTAK